VVVYMLWEHEVRVRFSALRLLKGVTRVTYGPIVKWYYAAFALLRREFDSP
jgi:hypothetical protein